MERMCAKWWEGVCSTLPLIESAERRGHVLGLPQPRRDVPFSAKQPPDIDVVVVLGVKHQIRESSQRPGSEARQVQLMGMAR